MDRNVSGQPVYYNPPWFIAILCVEHLRVCHSRSPFETRAVAVLLDWSKFRAITKELKLIKRLPMGKMVFMSFSPTGTYALPDLIPYTWPIHFLLIDANTPVLSPLLTTNVSNLKPNIVKSEWKPNIVIETKEENLSTTIA